jgi:formate hydrogenlyase subunit 4
VNPLLSLALAVLVYPGLLAALVAAGVLGWVRSSARGALSGSGARNPLVGLGELRVAFRRESLTPDGVHPSVITLLTATRLICPVLALIMLPVPGNPVVATLGLPGDLAAAGALLLGVPLARLALGWAIPSASTRLAADGEARLLAGAALPAAFGLTSASQLADSLLPATNAANVQNNALLIVAAVLSAAAFACAMPVLARSTALRQDDSAADATDGDGSVLTGQDLVYARVAEALQLVAVSGLFVAAFVLPPLRSLPPSVNRTLLWVIATILTAAGIGAWEGMSGQMKAGDERPPLSWWLGIPVLLGLASLVATAWATRT